MLWKIVHRVHEVIIDKLPDPTLKFKYNGIDINLSLLVVGGSPVREYYMLFHMLWDGDIALCFLKKYNGLTISYAIASREDILLSDMLSICDIARDELIRYVKCRFSELGLQVDILSTYGLEVEEWSIEV